MAQWVQMLIQDAPYQFVIQAKIFMGKLISKSGNLTPANGRVSAFKKFNTIILEGLPYDFEVAQKRIADNTVFQKVLLFERLQLFGDKIDAIEGMHQKYAPIHRHSGRASLRMRSFR